MEMVNPNLAIPSPGGSSESQFVREIQEMKEFLITRPNGSMLRCVLEGDPATGSLNKYWKSAGEVQLITGFASNAVAGTPISISQLQAALGQATTWRSITTKWKE